MSNKLVAKGFHIEGFTPYFGARESERKSSVMLDGYVLEVSFKEKAFPKQTTKLGQFKCLVVLVRNGVGCPFKRLNNATWTCAVLIRLDP